MRFKRFSYLAVVMAVMVPAYPASAQSEPSARAGDSVPAALTLPAGSIITVRTTQLLSSDRNRPGEEFTVVLDEPVVAQGWVVARRGQTVIGRVVDAQRAGHGQSASRLAIELNELVLVDGQQALIQTELVQVLGPDTRQRDQVATVGATTGIGAVIGAVAGGGKGAAIGAAIGAAAGVAGALSTPGRPTEIYPEARMTFRIQNQVPILTEKSRQAFWPVDSRDYEPRAVRNPDRYPERAYSSPPRIYYYSPNGYYDYWYGDSYAGLYLGYYRPYYYVGPRVYIRPEYRRRR
jgi:hypothetical protein